MSADPDWLRPDWAASHCEAFMTTRAGGVSRGPYASMNVGSAVHDEPALVAENRERVAQALGAPLVFLNQVHGAAVLRLKPEQALPGAKSYKADAAVSSDPRVGVAIQVADCLPVLFAAPRAVGGAHAGWRGLAGGVLENSIAALCEASDCQPRDIQAWLGACIGAEAFEVGAEVLQAFGREPVPGQDADAFAYRPNTAGEPRWRGDLLRLARQHLHEAGVSRISGGHWCTVSEPSRFFSYRRERLSGRMVAAIRLR
ncbi:peptidoglycan editing factor PgeF [Paucibacter sp. APW11]|uniref:Purine nucleoside phosphorylase n=1 Tax=Roseateles aquae TaxID=3077235 RepID=A0ABU3PG55_9BURK|nr:peptidoglycan editing factor PgeF [Paucibacter sp. APW11]MDT9001503.1 peptidoglycan editing factor PgeF [Paucibacter sp. APW11]